MRPVLMAFPLLLAACAPVNGGAETPPPEHGAGACNADKAQGFVGQQGTVEVAAQARDAAGASTIRWLRPGMAVTMDYRTDRLNIELDAGDKIISIRCG